MALMRQHAAHAADGAPPRVAGARTKQYTASSVRRLGFSMSAARPGTSVQAAMVRGVMGRLPPRLCSRHT